MQCGLVSPCHGRKEVNLPMRKEGYDCVFLCLVLRFVGFVVLLTLGTSYCFYCFAAVDASHQNLGCGKLGVGGMCVLCLPSKFWPQRVHSNPAYS